MTNLEYVTPFHWSSVSTRVVGTRLAKRLDLTTARALEIPRATSGPRRYGKAACAAPRGVCSSCQMANRGPDHLRRFACPLSW